MDRNSTPRQRYDDADALVKRVRENELQREKNQRARDEMNAETDKKIKDVYDQNPELRNMSYKGKK